MEKVESARIERKVYAQISRMERLTGLIPETDPDARGDVALHTELRRTVNRIRILDEWLQELGEQALGWGRASSTKDVKTQTGFSEKGDDSYEQITKTFEARVNVYYEIQMRERVHLVNISKVWIGAGFKQRELDLQERQVMAYNAGLLEVCSALGHDPSDPAVRNVIHRVMSNLASTPPAAIEARLVR